MTSEMDLVGEFDEMSEPAWVMVGFTFRGMPAILASRELTGGQLRAEMANVDEVFAKSAPGWERDAWPPTVPVYRYTVQVEMGRITLVYGANYGEALAELLCRWDPDRLDEAPALALEAGDGR